MCLSVYRLCQPYSITTVQDTDAKLYRCAVEIKMKIGFEDLCQARTVDVGTCLEQEKKKKISILNHYQAFCMLKWFTHRGVNKNQSGASNHWDLLKESILS